MRRPQVPICLDLGTNTQRYLDDPLYIGVRRLRPTGQEVRPSEPTDAVILTPY